MIPRNAKHNIGLTGSTVQRIRGKLLDVQNAHPIQAGTRTGNHRHDSRSCFMQWEFALCHSRDGWAK